MLKAPNPAFIIRLIWDDRQIVFSFMPNFSIFWRGVLMLVSLSVNWLNTILKLNCVKAKYDHPLRHHWGDHQHCQRSMATFDSEPHVSMLEHPVCSLAARRLGDMAQNPGGHKSGALLPGRRDSQPQFPIYSFFSNKSWWMSHIFQPAVSMRHQLPSHGKEKSLFLF